MTLTLLIAVVAALALLLTALATPIVRGAAIGLGLVPRAREDRWHTRPTPAVGGVAIFGGFLTSLAVGFALHPEAFLALRSELGGQGMTRGLPGVTWSSWEGLLVASVAVFALGLVDDLVQLRPATKLAGQVGAAVLLLTSGIGLRLLGEPLIDGVISVVWFVAITNAVNLLDNMDGLAAGVAAVAGLCLSAIFLLDGRPGLVLLSLTFTGAVLGFLLHNYPPARIFMGDSGSLFLGLFLSALALSPGEGLSRSLLAVVAVPALILAIPILDTSVVTVSRLLEGRPVTEGGKDHTSHRLVSLGVPEDRAVWLLWGLAAAGGGLGLVLRDAARSTAALVGGAVVVVLVLVGAYFLSIRFRSLERARRGRGEPAAEPSLQRVVLALHGRFPVMLLLLDALLVVLAYYAAYLVRWSPAELEAELGYFRSSVLVVVGVKLLAFGVGGLYDVRWLDFTLADGLRVARSAVLGSLAAVVALFLLERTGLSRGVLVIDLMLTGLLLLVSRLSFLLMEGAASRLSADGSPTLVVAPVQDAGLASRALVRADAPLRMVGVVDPGYDRIRGRVAGFPVFGGEGALPDAVRETGATAVVVMGWGPLYGPVEDYLEHEGALDVYRLRLGVERVDRAGIGPTGLSPS